MNPLLLIDFYKADHRSQYPSGTSLVYSNLTPRQSRVEGSDRMVFFGLQYFIRKYLLDSFRENFFRLPKDLVVRRYQEAMDESLGVGTITSEHIASLHDLGHLPLQINAVPEGTLVPMQVPMMTFWNTHPGFFWLTNYLETLMSTVLWKPCTSATTAALFRRKFDHYSELTGADPTFCQFQGHDFSFRGLSGVEDACTTGAAHLLSFVGTDTVPAIQFLKEFYLADLRDDLIGTSVPATEHSVMSADDEYTTMDRLLTQVYPKGIVSIVSDTYDFWKIVTDYLPSRREMIMARNGKLVIRPDTGTPNLVLCGDPDATAECEKKGLIRCLNETFGGTITTKGFIRLDSHVGAIYGDSISLKEQDTILRRLMDNGYASTNVVLGVGSYAYQYVTRDTYGTAIKATYCEVDGMGRDIFKSPKTGSWKKSRRGLLRVNPDFTVEEGVSWDRQGGILEPVFRNSSMLRVETLAGVRERLRSQQ